MKNQLYYRVRVFRDDNSDKEIVVTRYRVEEVGNAINILSEEDRSKIRKTALEGFLKDVIPNPLKNVFELEQYVEINQDLEG